MELFAIPWIVAFGLVVWWASVWGRSVFWAVVGALFLTPLVWGVVLLILGPDRETIG
ncbi:hypothetical protein [uncultured Albimonas sp.]|uniref:hypothetical protein n=1 Tax=uncultured Albimonas sp. TaxID=1331701 RepID=UPI0030EC94F8|tara:strand:- start:250 stop:420 length:171 start_codon:yes stop_codon:yes gene_type:complete